MVTTDHDLQLQQRRQESRAFMLRALTPIATALGEGYEVELPQDITHEGTGHIVMPDGKRLTFNYEKLNAGRGQFDVRGDLTVENISLHNHLPHGKHNPHINVTVTRPPVDIARDIKRRLLPAYEAIVLASLQRWRDIEATKRNIVSESAKYIEASCGMLHSSPHNSESVYSAQFHIYSNQRDSRIISGTVTVYADHAEFNRLSNVPTSQALQIITLLAEADGRTGDRSATIQE
jgi:ketosteroid isomerase-like protein